MAEISEKCTSGPHALCTAVSCLCTCHPRPAKPTPHKITMQFTDAELVELHYQYYDRRPEKKPTHDELVSAVGAVNTEYVRLILRDQIVERVEDGRDANVDQ